MAKKTKKNPFGAGRPTKLTPELAEQMAACYSEAVGIAHAARTCGVHPETAYKWMKENPGFAGLMREAKSKAITVAMNKMHGVDTKWWLQQADKKRFGDPARKIDLDVGLKPATSDAVKLARELLKNDEARGHLEAATRALVGPVVASEPVAVRDALEPGEVD